MKKRNNKGVSLVEFLIALAVGSIVLSAVVFLVQQAVKGYQSQTVMAQIESDADTTMNQISDTIMEAGITSAVGTGSKSTTVAIDNYIDNGIVTDVTNKLALKNKVVYVYDKTAQILYLAADMNENGESVVCKNVSAFNAKIISSGINVSSTGADNGYITAIKNPVQLCISLSITKDGRTRTITRNTALRNSLTDIKVLTGANETGVLNALRSSISNQYFQ
jgi:prepilin-type N-terminal cleavage/methylation domain-containing protein